MARLVLEHYINNLNMCLVKYVLKDKLKKKEREIISKIAGVMELNVTLVSEKEILIQITDHINRNRVSRNFDIECFLNLDNDVLKLMLNNEIEEFSINYAL